MKDLREIIIIILLSKASERNFRRIRGKFIVLRLI